MSAFHNEKVEFCIVEAFVLHCRKISQYKKTNFALRKIVEMSLI